MTPLSALRAEALACRAAGDHAGAARLWRALLDHAPDDWALGMELFHDLRAVGVYPDSDARFRRAAARLPDAAWLEHYAFFYSYHGAALAGIAARATALLGQWPEEPRLHVILADVARHRRDWALAAQHFDAAAALDPTQHDHAHRARVVRLYAALASRAWPDTGPAFACHVINMDRNTARMAEVERQYAGSAAPLHRIAAVEGARLPGAAVKRLTGALDAPRGTLGCFLSHAAAWEALLASEDACALVLEDDTIPLLNLPARLGGLPLPQGWDVVWANDRMEPVYDPGIEGFATKTLAATVQAFWPESNAPGGDGYFISRAGAAKLLAWVAEDGMLDDVDWRMVAYSMTPADVAAVPADIVARRHYLDRMGPAIPRAERLASHVLYPALIRSVGLDSDREDANRGGAV